MIPIIHSQFFNPWGLNAGTVHRLYEQMKVELKPSGVLVGSARYT